MLSVRWQLGTFAKQKSLSARIRFMCLDVLDLQRNGWKPRMKKAEAKTIAEIHRDNALEQAMERHKSHGRRRDDRGSRGFRDHHRDRRDHRDHRSHHDLGGGGGDVRAHMTSKVFTRRGERSDSRAGARESPPSQPRQQHSHQGPGPSSGGRGRGGYRRGGRSQSAMMSRPGRPSRRSAGQWVPRDQLPSASPALQPHPQAETAPGTVQFKQYEGKRRTRWWVA